MEAFASGMYRSLHVTAAQNVDITKIGETAPSSSIPLAHTRAANSRPVLDTLKMEDLLNSVGIQHAFAPVPQNYPPFFKMMAGEGNGAPETIRAYQALYGEGPEGVDKIDHVPGLLLEKKSPNSGLGQTQTVFFLKAASDRISHNPFMTTKYTPEYYTREGLNLVERADLKNMLLLHYPEMEKTGLAHVNNALEPWGTDALSHPEEHTLTASNLENYSPEQTAAMHAARYGTRNRPEGTGPVSFFGEDGKVTARSAFGAIHDGLQKPGVVVSSILAGGVKALKAMIAKTGYGAPEKAAAFLRAVDLGRGETTLEDLMCQTQADAQGQGKVTQGVLHAEAKVGWSTLLRLAGRENAAGERFVTPAELKSFLDGTLFFDLADGNAQRLQNAHWAGQKLTFERL